MKLSGTKRLMVGALVGFMLLIGVGSTAANAQVRHGRGRAIIVRPYDPFWHRHYAPYTVVDPIAREREHGYRDGKDDGEKDAKRGEVADPTDEKDFRESRSNAYRQAFVEGYRDGYREKADEYRGD